MGEILFNHKAHKKLWLWLAKNPNKDKNYWHGWEEFNEQYIENDCFACRYAVEMQRRLTNAHFCSLCPLDFDIPFKKHGSIHADCLGGLYKIYVDLGRFHTKRNLKMRVKLARKIAKLPVKRSVKCL